MPPEINPSERSGDSATRRMAARMRAVVETSAGEAGSADKGSRERTLRLVARPLWIVAVCALVAVLRVGREVLIPLVAAVLLALVLSGVVETLRRYRIPR